MNSPPCLQHRSAPSLQTHCQFAAWSRPVNGVIRHKLMLQFNLQKIISDHTQPSLLIKENILLHILHFKIALGQVWEKEKLPLVNISRSDDVQINYFRFGQYST